MGRFHGIPSLTITDGLSIGVLELQGKQWCLGKGRGGGGETVASRKYSNHGGLQVEIACSCGGKGLGRAWAAAGTAVAADGGGPEYAICSLAYFWVGQKANYRYLICLTQKFEQLFHVLGPEAF